MKCGGQVDTDNRVPFFHREVFHRRHELDAGVVDQDVDRTEGGRGVADHRRDVVGYQHVSRRERYLAA